MILAASIAANSFLADSSCSSSGWWALANTIRPGKVGTVSAAKKPLGGNHIWILRQTIMKLLRGRKKSYV